MRAFGRARRVLDSPNLLFRGINRLYHRRGGTRAYNTDGIDVFDEEWDNLLILDACRYDLFQEVESPDGKLESRVSRGSSTNEFLAGNVDQRQLHDTVYVTGNPQYYKHRDELNASFHDVRQIWLESGWDETHGTVLPETVFDRALEAHETYPNKRLVIHFMQPHYPFIGAGQDPFSHEQTSMATDGPNCWDHLVRGKLRVDATDVWDAYRANLVRVMPTVTELTAELTGRTVVTADHGNMVGERSRPVPNVEWGHPRGIYTDQLVKVPWLVIDGTRREITAEPPQRQTEGEATDDVVADRLKQLGYV